MGDHMPVHLGSMPASVAAARAALHFEAGDIALLNDPFAGGTHLPDLTLVMPVFIKTKSAPQFFIASRAHHADIGGALAGSMGPATEIFQEGLRIPPVKIFRKCELNREVLDLLLANVRTPAERQGDLAAQIASCRLGERRLREVVINYGLPEVHRYAEHLLDYSEKMMRSVLRSLHPGVYRVNDFLDSDGISKERLRIRVTIRIQSESILVNFSGSSPQCAGNINAVSSIAISAVITFLGAWSKKKFPRHQACFSPLSDHPQQMVMRSSGFGRRRKRRFQRMVDTQLLTRFRRPARAP
jgi:N-methylhydantoinase B